MTFRKQSWQDCGRGARTGLGAPRDFIQCLAPVFLLGHRALKERFVGIIKVASEGISCSPVPLPLPHHHHRAVAGGSRRRGTGLHSPHPAPLPSPLRVGALAPCKQNGREFRGIPRTQSKSRLPPVAAQFLTCKLKESDLKSLREVLAPAVLAGACPDFCIPEVDPAGREQGCP